MVRSSHALARFRLCSPTDREQLTCMLFCKMQENNKKKNILYVYVQANHQEDKVILLKLL